MGLIAGGIEQRDWPMGQSLDQSIESRLRRGLCKFAVVSGLEAAPSRWIPMQPAAQRIARRDFLQPEIDLGALSRQTARPQPIHQYAECRVYATACCRGTLTGIL